MTEPEAKKMRAAEVAQDYAESGFDGFEEVLIPEAMTGKDPAEFGDTWTTFYEAISDGEHVAFEVAEGVYWRCPVDREVEVR